MSTDLSRSPGGGAAPEVPAAPPSLAVTADGVTLQPGSRTAVAGDVTEYAFRIVDAGGATVTDVDLEHERRMHVIVVRRDLTGFQHLHPVMDADGTWRVRLRIDEPGVHRVFADFSREGRSTTPRARSGPRPAPRRPRPPGRAAGGRPGLPPRPPARRRDRRGGRLVPRRVAQRRPVPAVPAVPAPRPHRHGAVHPRGGPVSTCVTGRPRGAGR